MPLPRPTSASAEPSHARASTDTVSSIESGDTSAPAKRASAAHVFDLVFALNVAAPGSHFIEHEWIRLVRVAHASAGVLARKTQRLAIRPQTLIPRSKLSRRSKRPTLRYCFQVPSIAVCREAFDAVGVYRDNVINLGYKAARGAV